MIRHRTMRNQTVTLCLFILLPACAESHIAPMSDAGPALGDSSIDEPCDLEAYNHRCWVNNGVDLDCLRWHLDEDNPENVYCLEWSE